MKNKSAFWQIMLLIVLAFICIAMTLAIAFLAGSVEVSMFDFSNLNIANMIPVFIFGGLATAFIMIIALLITSRSLFYKVKAFLEEANEENTKK